MRRAACVRYVHARLKYGRTKLSARRVRAGRSVTAEVTVTNAGPRRAAEVVHLYLADDEASAAAPPGARSEALGAAPPAVWTFELI